MNAQRANDKHGSCKSVSVSQIASDIQSDISAYNQLAKSSPSRLPAAPNDEQPVASEGAPELDSDTVCTVASKIPKVESPYAWQYSPIKEAATSAAALQAADRAAAQLTASKQRLSQLQDAVREAETLKKRELRVLVQLHNLHIEVHKQPSVSPVRVGLLPPDDVATSQGAPSPHQFDDSPNVLTHEIQAKDCAEEAQSLVPGMNEAPRSSQRTGAVTVQSPSPLQPPTRANIRSSPFKLSFMQQITAISPEIPCARNSPNAAVPLLQMLMPACKAREAGAAFFKRSAAPSPDFYRSSLNQAVAAEPSGSTPALRRLWLLRQASSSPAVPGTTKRVLFSSPQPHQSVASPPVTRIRSILTASAQQAEIKQAVHSIAHHLVRPDTSRADREYLMKRMLSLIGNPAVQVGLPCARRSLWS